MRQGKVSENVTEMNAINCREMQTSRQRFFRSASEIVKVLEKIVGGVGNFPMLESRRDSHESESIIPDFRMMIGEEESQMNELDSLEFQKNLQAFWFVKETDFSVVDE